MAPQQMVFVRCPSDTMKVLQSRAAPVHPRLCALTAHWLCALASQASPTCHCGVSTSFCTKHTASGGQSRLMTPACLVTMTGHRSCCDSAFSRAASDACTLVACQARAPAAAAPWPWHLILLESQTAAAAVVADAAAHSGSVLRMLLLLQLPLDLAKQKLLCCQPAAF